MIENDLAEKEADEKTIVKQYNLIKFLILIRPARRPFYRDCICYMIGCSWMFGLYWSRGRKDAEGEPSGIYWWDGLLMLAFYAGKASKISPEH